MTNQQVKQELGKTLNKNLKSIGEAILSENLMREPHENEIPNLKTVKTTQ